MKLRRSPYHGVSVAEENFEFTTGFQKGSENLELGQQKTKLMAN